MNRNAMTILLWHFTALVLAAVVLLPLGVVPSPREGSGAWWLVRIAAVPVLALVLAPIVVLAGRVERRPAGPARCPRWSWGPVVAVPLVATACALVTLDGLSTAGPLGLPVIPAALLLGGTALLAPAAPAAPASLPNRRSDPAGGRRI
jgi:hypothetical protein